MHSGHPLVRPPIPDSPEDQDEPGHDEVGESYSAGWEMKANSGWLDTHVDVGQDGDGQEDARQSDQGPPMIDHRQDTDGDPDDHEWREAPVPDGEDGEPVGELF